MRTRLCFFEYYQLDPSNVQFSLIQGFVNGQQPFVCGDQQLMMRISEINSIQPLNPLPSSSRSLSLSLSLSFSIATYFA